MDANDLYLIVEKGKEKWTHRENQGNVILSSIKWQSNEEDETIRDGVVSLELREKEENDEEARIDLRLRSDLALPFRAFKQWNSQSSPMQESSASKAYIVSFFSFPPYSFFLCRIPSVEEKRMFQEEEYIIL